MTKGFFLIVIDLLLGVNALLLVLRFLVPPDTLGAPAPIAIQIFIVFALVTIRLWKRFDSARE